MVIVDESSKNICNYVICTQKCGVWNLNSMCIMSVLLYHPGLGVSRLLICYSLVIQDDVV